MSNDNWGEMKPLNASRLWEIARKEEKWYTNHIPFLPKTGVPWLETPTIYFLFSPAIETDCKSCVSQFFVWHCADHFSPPHFLEFSGIPSTRRDWSSHYTVTRGRMFSTLSEKFLSSNGANNFPVPTHTFPFEVSIMPAIWGDCLVFRLVSVLLVPERTPFCWLQWKS